MILPHNEPKPYEKITWGDIEKVSSLCYFSPYQNPWEQLHEATWFYTSYTLRSDYFERFFNIANYSNEDDFIQTLNFKVSINEKIDNNHKKASDEAVANVRKNLDEGKYIPYLEKDTYSIFCSLVPKEFKKSINSFQDHVKRLTLLLELELFATKNTYDKMCKLIPKEVIHLKPSVDIKELEKLQHEIYKYKNSK